MVRHGVATLDPFHGGAQQHHPLLGPLSDAPRFGVTIIRSHRLGTKVVDEVGGLLIDDVTFGHGSKARRSYLVDVGVVALLCSRGLRLSQDTTGKMGGLY
jgi:hypothetical protein